MTELKDELKIRPDEDALEYEERTQAALERHYEETGERFKPTDDLPGERPGECLERFKKLDEAFNIRGAERELRAAERERTQGKPSTSPTNDANKDTSAAAAAAEKSRRSYRLKSQDRDLQRAGDAFEDAEKKLYRMNGTKLYSEEEHEERIGKLREEFAQQIEKVVAEAETDAKGYEKEALAFSYTDPASQVSASERSKLETSRAFVKEDCERLSVEELTDRLGAVSAGSDKVAKILHSRYGSYRVRSIEERRNQEFQTGTASLRPGSSVEAGRLSSLRAAVRELEEQLTDPKTEERRQAVEEAAKASRKLIRDARGQQSKVDGTAELARQRQAEMARAAF